MTVVGCAASTVPIRIRPRSAGWRLRRASAMAAVFGVVTPVAFLIPPHAPWGVGALTAGSILVWRRWKERETVEEFAAPCPRCGNRLTIPAGTRLRRPHVVPCGECRYDASVEIGSDPIEVGS